MATGNPSIRIIMAESKNRMSGALELLREKLFCCADPQQPALVAIDQCVTYGELAEKAGRLAVHFEQQGVRPGERIAVLLPSCIEFILCYFAAIIGGYVVVPVNMALPQKDIDYILSITKPKLTINDVYQLNFVTPASPIEIKTQPQDIGAIFFTSGTVGRPKGVCHTVENLLANAVAFNRLTGLDDSVRMLHVMPIGYMAGYLNTILCPILAGGTVILGPQFNAAEAMHFWKPAIEHNANAMWLTPTMVALLARLNRSDETPQWTKNNLKHVFVGTAPLPRVAQEAFEQMFGVECLESYGMSELMFVSSNKPNDSHSSRSVGQLLEGVKVQINNKDGDPLPVGTSGQLYINSPFALEGYLTADEKDLESPLRSDWLDTGDVGHIDEENHLYITGRVKDLIIHGGMNVCPRAVEEELYAYPGVQDAAVVGRPHPFWGEEVVAFIVMKQGEQFDKNALLAYCKENLPEDAVPAAFIVRDDLPRSSTGKIQKNELKETL